MPTFIKTGFWDKKAKAPDGWLDLNLFVETLIPPTPLGTNIYNSNGTLNSYRYIDANNFGIDFNNINVFTLNPASGGSFSFNKNQNLFYVQLGNSSIKQTLQLNNTQSFFGYETSGLNTKGLLINQSGGVYDFFLGDTSNLHYRISSNFHSLYINSQQRFALSNDAFGVSATGIFITGDSSNAIFRGSIGGLNINNNSNIISLFSGGNLSNVRGSSFDFTNRVYQFGQIAGNNATTLKIDDAATFPVQVSGTNVTQNTSGTASGKFLKIKVDGVDYVIELKNPS